TGMWISNNLRVTLTQLQNLPAQIRYGFAEFKLGRMLLGVTPISKDNKLHDAICAMYFVLSSDAATLEEVRQHWPKVAFVHDDEAVRECSRMLCEDKENSDGINVAVWGTDFQLAVWRELLHLKAGSKITYTELAERMERPNAVRAVANAVAKNEVALLIPCHRIVSKNGATKYHWGAKLKHELLRHEANTQI
ncbi:hypothetical protein KR222_000656, partial [Zaprionus bogoriensis]